MGILVIIAPIIAAVMIVYSLSHIIWMAAGPSIGQGCLFACLLTFIIWVVAPDQMAWIALGSFLIFLPVRVYYRHIVEIPREAWQTQVKANIYQQTQNRWPDATVIKVRGHAFGGGSQSLPKYPTLFVPADSTVLSDEIIADGEWQIEEFRFLSLYQKDRVDLKIYMVLRLHIGTERFVLPIVVAESVIDNLKLDEEGIHILRALNQAKQLSFVAYSKQWPEVLRRGKYKGLPLLDRSTVFYEDAIVSKRHYSFEIPPPSIQALETYITNHEMDPIPSSSFGSDKEKVVNISFYRGDRGIEYIHHELKFRSIRERIVKFLFMPLPPFPDPYQ